LKRSDPVIRILCRHAVRLPAWSEPLSEYWIAYTELTAFDGQAVLFATIQSIILSS